MKKYRIFIIILLFFLVIFFSFSFSFAKGEEDELWNDFEEIIPEGVLEGSSADEMLSGVGMDSLLSALISATSDGVGHALSFLLLLLGICALLSLAEMNAFSLNEKNGERLSMGICLISSLIIFHELSAPIDAVSEGLQSLSSFFNAITPIFTAILLAGGNTASAAAQTVNLNITFGATSHLATNFLLPLCSSLFAFALLSGISDGAVSSISKGVRSLFNWALGIATTVIIGASSMQSVVAAAKDSAYLRAAKYAASGMIPVVGSTVSGALGTLAGGLSYLKSTIGIASVFVIISISLSPLVSLLLLRFAFSISLTFLEFTSCTGGVRVFSAFRSAIDALISVYCVAAVVYVSQVVIFIKGGATVFA